MDANNLGATAAELLEAAHSHASGRSARTIHGGHEHSLRQTLIALVADRALDDHESPGEATLQVLSGRVRLGAGEETWEGVAGDWVVIPPVRHRLDAVEDSAVLLTVATRT